MSVSKIQTTEGEKKEYFLAIGLHSPAPRKFNMFEADMI
jgi:hypothetical protein